jgi:septum formation protein
MNFKHKLLLASQSPRRRELLGNLGFEVEIIDQFSDEIYPHDLDTAEIASFLALKKANSITRVLLDNEILVCADTIVILNNIVFEKPKDKENASKMLRQLSGHTHQVHTGVCLKNKIKTETFTGITDVTFKEFSTEEIEYYVSNFKPFDKAGSYGIQEWLGFIGIEHINGCYYNVMGLPLSLIYKKIRSFTV